MVGICIHAFTFHGRIRRQLWPTAVSCDVTSPTLTGKSPYILTELHWPSHLGKIARGGQGAITDQVLSQRNEIAALGGVRSRINGRGRQLMFVQNDPGYDPASQVVMILGLAG
jgi:hypothetical protein